MLIGISGRSQITNGIVAGMISGELIMRNSQLRRGELQIRRFGDKLKDMICVLTGCTRAELENDSFRVSNMPPEWNRWMVHYDNGQIHDAKGSEWFCTYDEAEAFRMRTLGKPYSKFDYYVKEHPITYQMMLQEVGVDLLRNKFHPDTLVNALFYEWHPIATESRHWMGHAITMEDEPVKYPTWIIADVCYNNEMARIKKYHGVVIRINEPGESKYDGFDAVIDNNGTLEALRIKVTDTVNKLNLKV